jgi:indolepyruvate ferredoxin oxidoreductase, beta subunit
VTRDDQVKLQIVCAGIGGRGVLLASTILIETAIQAGCQAIASDEYGMSQRGGSVVSLVKIGPFKSPLIGRESADVLLSFEESEFYRNLSFLKTGGIAVVNTAKPGLEENIGAFFRERKGFLHLIDADGIAARHGVAQSANMAVLGFFASLSVAPYSRENLQESIEKRLSGKFTRKNLDVFTEACELASAGTGAR